MTPLAGEALTPEVEKLRADILDGRYGRPINAALHLCHEFEKRLMAAEDALRLCDLYVSDSALKHAIVNHPAQPPITLGMAIRAALTAKEPRNG